MYQSFPNDPNIQIHFWNVKLNTADYKFYIKSGVITLTYYYWYYYLISYNFNSLLRLVD